LNNLKTSGQNYVSKNFGGTYFTLENAKKIGAIREEIESLQITEEEKAILLTSLLYAMDKVANTVGHYEAYRKILDTTQEIRLMVPDINVQNNQNNKIYNKDANDLIKEIECDVLYIDPPYNSRQYGDAYHLLENIISWKKPKVLGIAKKMEEREHLKSKYCLKSAPEAFRELILNAKTKHILLSYNNTADSKNSRSNARISDKSILETLRLRGRVDIFERDYRGFTAGKSDASGNSERVFYCRVTN
jgi:adenine-specific DNA-methyltransferase